MKALRYDQIYLIPRYSELRSRSEADISVEFLGRRFAAPWLPANMQSVLNEDIAHWLSENDFPYIFHRFSDTRAFIERANRENWKLISISVGVKEQDRELLKWVVAQNLRVDWICVDIAHGHSVLMKEMIGFIKELQFKSFYGDYIQDSFSIRDGIAAAGRGLTSVPLEYFPKIIAGNVATPEAVKDLIGWGANCVKVHVGPGRACSTKTQTGFHVPTFTCALNCAAATKPDFFIQGGKDIPLIFDGGIRENGDIAKALVAGGGGANLVMIGSVLAACVDAPGESVYEEVYEGPKNISGSIVYGGSFYVKRLTKKRFYGSASAKQKGAAVHVEGFEVDLPCNGLTYKEKYQEIRESLQSAVSYGGGKDLSAFKNVEWVEVS